MDKTALKEIILAQQDFISRIQFTPLRRCLIVTRHEEGTLTEGDLTIEICSVWKWLLQEMLVR